MSHEPLPRAFIDFIYSFPRQRIAEAQDATDRLIGTPYHALCKAYLLQLTDMIACRDALLALGDSDPIIAPWRSLWLGTIFAMTGQLAEAEASFVAAIANAPDDGFKCRVYVNWSGAIMENNTNQEKEMARRAAAVIEQGLRIEGDYEGTRIMLRANLGLCYKILGRYAEAIPLFEAVLAYTDEQGNPTTSALASSDLADLHRRKGEFTLALEYGRRAWALINRCDVVANDKIDVLTLLISVERDAGNLAQALDHAAATISLAESTRAQTVTEQDRISYFALLRRCYDEAILCCLELGDVEQAFNLTEKARARTFADMDRIAPASFTPQLVPTDLALIAYYAIQDRLLAFVVTHEGVVIQALGSMTTLSQAFGEDGYPRNLLPGANGKLRKSWVLDRVAEQIARPLHPLVSAYERLCLIPFGILHHLPLSVLFEQRSLRAPSVTVFLGNGQARSGAGEVLAFGYNGHALRHAEAEAQAVGGSCFVGADATSKTLFAKAQCAKWLHLSTHGVFDQHDPMRSYIELADGPLYAHQVTANLRLQADLVVLSACNSGINQILPGDEPLGLVRSFLRAGAASVMVTLWPVNEVATRLLMEYFYQDLRAGYGAADALNLARQRLRTLRRSELSAELSRPGLPKGVGMEIATLTDDTDCPFAHPYWWAGFDLIGNRSGA